MTIIRSSESFALGLVLLSVGALLGCEGVNCPLGTVKRNGYCIEVEALEDGGSASADPQDAIMASARKERVQAEEKANAEAAESEADDRDAKPSGGAGRSGSGGKSGAASGGRSGASGATGRDTDREHDSDSDSNDSDPEEDSDSSSAAGESGSGSSSKSGSAGRGGSESDSDDADDSGDSRDSGDSGGGAGSSGSKASGAAGKSSAPEPEEDTPKEPEPPPADPECEGHAGETVCDGRNMIACNDDAQIDDTSACKTDAQCEAGLEAGACGMCDPGAYKCDGKALQVCSREGRFEKERDCPSAALCSEDNQSCDPAACTPGAKMCKDGGVVTCNDDQTGWKEVERCRSPDLCDNSKKRCNDCKPNDAHCEDDTLVKCSADGSGPSQNPCSGKTPRCLRDRCVACKQPSDCTADDSSGGCMVPGCETANGTCTRGTPVKKGNECTDRVGYCDGNGKCVACTEHDHCAISEECQSDGRCKAVEMMTVTSHTKDSYTVRVARKVSITAQVDFNRTYITGSVTIGTCTVSHEVPGGVSEDAFITDLNKIPDTRETCTIAAKPQAYDLTIKRTGPTVGECADKTGTGGRILLGFEDTSKVTAEARSQTVEDCVNPSIDLTATYAK